MPDPITGGIAAIGAIGSSVIGANAANKAGKAEAAAAQAGVAEQRAAREELRKLLQPYVAAGTPALKSQMDYLGLNGGAAQNTFVQQQANNPLFQAIAKQGEDAILQNASATGNLRGGNAKAALAQFRPALLQQFLDSQYSKLGGITQMGQNSAAGVGSAGMTSASNIAELLGRAGEARAGAALGQGAAFAQPFNLLTQFAGMNVGQGGKLF